MSALVLAACLFVPDGGPAASPPEKAQIPFGGTDFKQYYATSKLIVEGQNPYDRDLVWRIQEPLGAKEAQVPYGPPTSLLPFVPLGWLDFPTAVQAFFMVNVSLMVVSCFLWGKMLFPDKEYLALLAVVTLLAWVPTMTLFWLGQVTAFPLFGFTLWTFLMRQGRPAWAGVALAVSVIKPHLAAGPLLYAGLVGLRQRRLGMIVAVVVTVGGMAVAAWLVRPSVWAEYLEALPLLNPTQWYNATLEGWGRRLLEEWQLQSGGPAHAAWFRWVGVAVAVLFAGWIGLLAWRHPLHPANALLALALWTVGTPYAFSYDYVLLAPCFILALGHTVLRDRPFWALAAAGWIVLDVSYLVLKTLGKAHGWYEDHFFFIPWGGLALTLLLLPHDQKVNHNDAKDTEKLR